MYACAVDINSLVCCQQHTQELMSIAYPSVINPFHHMLVKAKCNHFCLILSQITNVDKWDNDIYIYIYIYMPINSMTQVQPCVI